MFVILKEQHMHLDYSIEYCHIYTNQSVGPEHAESLDYLVKLKDKLNKNNETFSLCVMLDNYTFPGREFDKDRFLSWLKSRGATPDIFINEADLIPAADEVISFVSPKRAKALRKYIQEKKYPCSLFIATWYLSRTGHLKNSPDTINKFSKRLINILHERFKSYEDEALEIISDTEFNYVINDITNIYFGGETYPIIEEHSLDAMNL